MKRSEVTGGVTMVLTEEEVKIIEEHRRNAEAFRRLALALAHEIYEREYERAMDDARASIAGIHASVKGGGE